MNSEKKARILYMEDDAEDVQILQEAIQSFGTPCEVLEARNGEEGLNLLFQLKQARSLPCAIVLDINMPRMNGKEAFQRIKADRDLATLPVLVFSTSTSDEDKHFFQGDKVEYISKPRTFSHLLQITEKLLSFCLY
jgi:CheY-like chemotaxis protein